MQRASYRRAIEWIAMNDSGLSEGALQATGGPDAVSDLAARWQESVTPSVDALAALDEMVSRFEGPQP